MVKLMPLLPNKSFVIILNRKNAPSLSQAVQADALAKLLRNSSDMQPKFKFTYLSLHFSGQFLKPFFFTRFKVSAMFLAHAENRLWTISYLLLMLYVSLGVFDGIFFLFPMKVYSALRMQYA
jgi:hypothetical protein